MKARRKGTDEVFKEIKSVIYKNGFVTDIKDLEFYQEQTIEIPFGARDSELQEVTYHIPDGYHAEIKGNEVVIKKNERLIL